MGSAFGAFLGRDTSGMTMGPGTMLTSGSFWPRTPDHAQVEQIENQELTVDEVRKTSHTGGQKGQKPNRQDLIAVPFLEQLGLVCGMGAEKYDDDNWRRGYSWRLSYGALLRHLQAFWTGEDLDGESGLPHLAHAAWHCMVLFTFSTQSKYAEFDDRPDLPELFQLSPEIIERLREYYGVGR